MSYTDSIKSEQSTVHVFARLRKESEFNVAADTEAQFFSYWQYTKTKMVV